MVAMPEKSLAGVNTQSLPWKAIVPGAEGTEGAMSVSGSPSGSVSLASRLTMTGLQKAVDDVSSTASGPGLTGASVTLAESVPPRLSATRTGIVTGPALSTGGMPEST